MEKTLKKYRKLLFKWNDWINFTIEKSFSSTHHLKKMINLSLADNWNTWCFRSENIYFNKINQFWLMYVRFLGIFCKQSIRITCTHDLNYNLIYFFIIQFESMRDIYFVYKNFVSDHNCMTIWILTYKISFTKLLRKG